MTDEKYEKCISKIIKNDQMPAKIAKLKKSGPFCGLIVTGIVPNSQAQKGGLQQGDIVVGVGDNKLYGLYSDWQRSNTTQLLHYYRRDEKRTLEIAPGIVGVQNDSYMRTDIWYAKSKFCDPKWDRDVLVALTSLNKNLNLAETAWAHAIEKGFPYKSILDVQASLIYYYRGKIEKALKLYRKNDISEFLSQGLFLNDAANILIANGEISSLAQLFSDYPQYFRKFEILFAEGGLKKHFLDKQNLNELQGNYKNQNILKEFKTIPYLPGIYTVKKFDPANFKPLFFQAKAGYYQNIVLELDKPLVDFEVTVKFWAIADPKETSWKKAFELVLLKKSVREGKLKTDLFRDSVVRTGIHFDSQNRSTVTNRFKKGTIFKSFFPDLALCFRNTQEIKLIKVGDTVITHWNDKVVTKAPVQSYKDDVFIYLFVSGMTVNILDISINELNLNP